MATTIGLPPRERAGVALASAAITALLGWALIAGLAVNVVPAAREALVVLQLLPADPPEPHRVVPVPKASKRPQGEAAPPALRANPTEVVAPKPVVVLPPPPQPVVAAPVARTGTAPTAGAAATPGPGQGAGGIGNGFGAGGSGDGDGGMGDETPPRRIKGRLKDSDFPAEAAESGIGGTVTVRYAVEVDGRVTGCRVVESSGYPELDAQTCRLITQRFRYDPSRDAYGRPVRSIIIVDHEWVNDNR
nr:energy transducer TonB [Sphingomonas jinjuensis]